MLVRPVPDITTMGLTELIMTLLLEEDNLLGYVSANKTLSTQMLEKKCTAKGSKQSKTYKMQLHTQKS